ncbi:unnamed protein product [Haemonchus placei]|uniref:PH domain-containing protein n=1 Tax=Haemonchus placei TaxID=6290 RepID=A0A0N4VZM8_HAEPC|nr:unnamed protein product [Haemonchus placei]
MTSSSRKASTLRISNAATDHRWVSRYARLPNGITETSSMQIKGLQEMMCESQSECTSWIRLFRAVSRQIDFFFNLSLEWSHFKVFGVDTLLLLPYHSSL